MQQVSAGLLMYRVSNTLLEFFLVHPGGPFFKNKDIWGIPKGLIEKNEDLLNTAIREFTEETGITPSKPYIQLGNIKQQGGKLVHAWAFNGNCENTDKIVSNLFEMEWPPKSGKFRKFPEIDKASFFNSETTKQKINPVQLPFIERIEEYLKNRPKL